MNRQLNGCYEFDLAQLDPRHDLVVNGLCIQPESCRAFHDRFQFHGKFGADPAFALYHFVDNGFADARFFRGRLLRKVKSVECLFQQNARVFGIVCF